ncbi:hypothetical protein [Longimicrobium sp.]|jgi:hypothetical protein|uniref:hypothetical protein n=1 Tax=Longimicrobium sp. TaxID=2029185 RepID=UPI002ED90675
MKKLKLQVEDLSVESFATACGADEHGTVQAHVGTLVGGSCPVVICQTYDDTLCGLTRGCE